MGTLHIPFKGIGSDVQTKVGTPHISIEGIWLDIQTRVGTPHRIGGENPYGQMGGWVGGSFRKKYHFVAPSCKLKLARFSA